MLAAVLVATENMDLVCRPFALVRKDSFLSRKMTAHAGSTPYSLAVLCGLNVALGKRPIGPCSSWPTPCRTCWLAEKVRAYLLGAMHVDSFFLSFYPP